MLYAQIIFYLSIFGILFPMIIYPISILIIGKLSSKENQKEYDLLLNVSSINIARNELKVIKNKLNTILRSNYPKIVLEIKKKHN